MIGDHLLVIALVHWRAWDDAIRDAWDRLWEEACEREPADQA